MTVERKVCDANGNFIMNSSWDKKFILPKLKNEEIFKIIIFVPAF